MSINNLIEYMFSTLSRLNLCLNNTNGIVKYDINCAINCFKKLLLKKDCEILLDNKSEKIDDIEVYNTLISISDDIQYYTDYFRDDYLIGAWWNVNLAINDLKVESSILSDYTSKKFVRIK